MEFRAQIKPAETGMTFMKVDQAGVYRLFVNIMSPEGDLAQSAS